MIGSGTLAESMRKGAGSTVFRQITKNAERVRFGCGKQREARFSAISFPQVIRAPAKRKAAEKQPPLRSKGVLPAPVAGRFSQSAKLEINDEERAMIDLTKLTIPTDGIADEEQTDNGVSAVCRVEAIFRDHRRRLIEEINRYPVVLGCVAWLTDYAVLQALATRESVSIIVQKEDFLKPDSRGTISRLRKLYDSLPGLTRWEIRYTSRYSYCGGGDDRAVRCVGNHNSDKRPAFPRMHNKFLVFCESVERQGEMGWNITPAKVWTGSYNISDNASRSWENAVLIDDPVIADAYAREYGQIFGLSEPLDWTSVWTAPEHRIGS